MSSIDSLFTCKTPAQLARVVNPMSPEYYLADIVKAADAARPESQAAVKVTISQDAKNAMPNSGKR